jgi:hypothetical protein
MAKIYKCINNEEHIFEVPTPDFYCSICPPYSSMLVLSDKKSEKTIKEVVKTEDIKQAFNFEHLKSYFPPVQGFKYGDRIKTSEIDNLMSYVQQIYQNAHSQIIENQVILYYDNTFKLGDKSGIFLMLNESNQLILVIFLNRDGIYQFNLNSPSEDSSLIEISFLNGILNLNFTCFGKEKKVQLAGFQKLVSESLIKFVKGYREEIAF